jgi:hypothetical protein
MERGIYFYAIKAVQTYKALQRRRIMLRMRYALLGMILIAFAGCGKENGDNKEPEEPAAAEESVDQAAQPEIAPVPAEPAAASPESQRTPAAVQPARTKQQPVRRSPEATAEFSRPEEVAPPVRRTETAAPAASLPEESPQVPAVQEPRTVTIAGGTAIQVRLQERLDSSVNKTGDMFEAILDEDIEVNGLVVAPRGSIFDGTLTDVVRSGRVEGRAKMSLQLNSLIIENQSYPLRTETLSFEAESTKKSDAAKVGLGAGIGAVIGAIAGGGKGAAIGAAVGGGAGGATVLATRGKEVVFEPEQKFIFVLSEDASINLP